MGAADLARIHAASRSTVASGCASGRTVQWDSVFYWLMKYLVAGPFLHTVFRPWVSGVENIPRTGAVILASNHLSFIDSVFLPLVIDRRMVFLAKSDYFTGRGFKGWLTKMFF